MSKKKSRDLKPVENKITVIPDTPPAQVTPMVMMQMAISEGSDVATMERLWALNEKVEAANAKKSYVSAMAQFKLNPPEIIKDKLVSYENNDGTRTSYTHASLGNVTDKIVERLGEYGFSHRWDVNQVDGGQIQVTCIVTHEQGHSESVMLSSSRDDTGKKNNIQQLSSAISYLQRYTLLAVTGLATHEMDDDGRSAEPEAVIELITEEQANGLHSKITEHDLDMERFKAWLKSDVGIELFEQIPSTWYERVNNRIDSAIRAQGQE